MKRFRLVTSSDTVTLNDGNHVMPEVSSLHTNCVNFEPDGKGGKRSVRDFAKMFRMKNHFKILSMAVESGAGAAGRGFHSFPRLNERWETSKVTNGIISWDNMQIMFVSSGQRVDS